MTDNKNNPSESASEKIFVQLEENMDSGGVRDVWLSLRKELNEGGPESVRSYLEAEYERRKTIVQKELTELSHQLEETT